MIKRMRQQTKRQGELVIVDVVIYTIMILLVIAILYPLYYMIIVSISDGVLVNRGEIKYLPAGINFDTYKKIFEDPQIVRSYANSLLYTGVGTFINVGMTALCAYPLARNYFWGRYVFTLMIVFTMFFDGGMIPKYLLVQNLGMLNSVWAIVIPPAINVWYMIIMRTFFQNIPNDLHDSAYMDGANDLQVFFRIIIPLSIPVFATIMMFYAVWHWNSFFPALIYLNEKSKYPMQLILRNIVIAGEIFNSSRSVNSRDLLVSAGNIKYAVIIVTILPIITIYPFVQKYFVKGVMIGSLKG